MLDGRIAIRKSRLFLFWAFSLALLFLSPQGTEAQLVKFRAVYPGVNVPYLPLSVAQAKGIFKSEGLDAELVVVRGANQGVLALVSGDAHFAMTIGPVLPAIWSGVDLKLLAQMVSTQTFSLIVRPEIKRFEDLKGKKIGVSFGGMTLVLARELFRLNGMEAEKEVDYVNIPGNGPKVIALEKGLISGALLPPPADVKMVEAGFRRLVFLGDILPDLPFTGLIATDRYIRENPKTVEKMVRAIVRAVYLCRDDPETAIGVMQSHLKMRPQEARETYPLVRKFFSPLLTESGVRRMAAVVSKSAGVKPTKEPKDYMDLSFLDRALSELGRR